MYNWYTVNSGSLCPYGWHVPTDAEWTTLENYLIANGYNYDGTTTGNKIVKALASTSLWTASGNTGAVGNTDFPAKRNATGLAVFPGGLRYSNGAFDAIGGYGNLWSVTASDLSNAWFRGLYYNYNYLDRSNYDKKSGFSVRCLKD